jgi:hypothetical protein
MEHCQKMDNKINIKWYGEFAYELTQCLPFAYWAHTKGILGNTQSYKDTACLYYFSSNHEEIAPIPEREGNCNDFPVKNIMDVSDKSMWIPPPYKEKYKNDEFVYEKPIVVINNKYNSEWNGPPLNFLSLPILKKIIEYLQEKYQVVYFRSQKDILEQTTHNYDLHDEKFIKSNFPNVLFIYDLLKEYKYTLNELQLMIYSNAAGFISTAGGNSTFCSYFGGTNLIYHKEGVPVSWYKDFSDANVILIDDYEKLLSLTKETFK